MNSKIEKSIVAIGGGTVKKSHIDNTSIVNKVKRNSFWTGFGVGILSSLVAGAIWYIIENFLIPYLCA